MLQTVGHRACYLLAFAALNAGPATSCHAESFFDRLPVKSRLNLPNDPQDPLPSSYAVPDLPTDKQILPRLTTDILTTQVGVELIVDGTAIGQDDANIDQVGEKHGRVTVRSATFKLKGEIGKSLLSYGFKIDYNGFDTEPDSNFSISEFNISMAIPAWRTAITIGQLRENFAYEAVGSTSTMPQSERILSPFISTYNPGFKVTHIFGDRADTTLSYGIFRDAWGDGAHKPALTARATHLFIDDPEQRRFLHLGVGVRHAEADDTSRYQGKAGVDEGGTVIDTGFFSANEANHLGLELQYTQRNWSVIAEHVTAFVAAPALGNPHFSGFYVLGSWVPTGESRRYDRLHGSVGRIEPTGRWGAPEIVARFARVSLNGGSIRGGRFDRLEGGVNWWATTRWKFGLLAGHTWLDRDGEAGNMTSLMTRIQWVY